MMMSLRSSLDDGFDVLAEAVAAVARKAHARGWVPATSGNFSAVLQREPLRLAITAMGADKERITAAQVVEIDGAGERLRGSGAPSAETPLHLAIVATRGAGAVVHTHSRWATLLSLTHERGVALEGYELLKALRGITTHEHREWLEVVENRQDWAAARPEIEATLRGHTPAHGFLIRGHGLYTWGEDLAEAWRHLETIEFLLEVEGRRR
jgi:methylthioribulose-1-phosphate dehydratase